MMLISPIIVNTMVQIIIVFRSLSLPVGVLKAKFKATIAIITMQRIPKTMEIIPDALNHLLLVIQFLYREKAELVYLSSIF